MNRFRLRTDNFMLNFDRDYGVNHKTGWSIGDEYGCIFHFEKSLILCVLKYVFYKIKKKFNLVE